MTNKAYTNRIFLLLSLLCIWSGPVAPAEPELLVVQPNPIEVDGLGRVSGSFTLIKGYEIPGVARRGIMSLGNGGGCLVTDLGESSKVCETEETCDDHRIHADGHGYCLQAPGDNQKICWYKGADSIWCEKHRPGTAPLKLNETVGVPHYYDPLTKFDADGVINPYRLHPGKMARYMVQTLLNGCKHTLDSDSFDCGPQKNGEPLEHKTWMSDPKLVSGGISKPYAWPFEFEPFLSPSFMDIPLNIKTPPDVNNPTRKE
jgi:hypothetical protein